MKNGIDGSSFGGFSNMGESGGIWGIRLRELWGLDIKSLGIYIERKKTLVIGDILVFVKGVIWLVREGHFFSWRIGCELDGDRTRADNKIGHLQPAII